jgi:TetR/AcrR family transcriptional regulator
MVPTQTFLNLPQTKRHGIIDVALKEFSNKGYQGASINAMVTQLGIAKGSIYQYFNDKNALFLFVFDRCMERVKDHLKHIRNRSLGHPLSERLKMVLAEGVRFIEEHPDVYKLYITLHQDPTIPMQQDLLRAIREHSLTYVQTFLDQALKNNELKPGIDLAQARFVIDAVMDRFLLCRALPHASHGTEIFNGSRAQVSQWIDGVVSVLCKGVTHD